MVRPGKGLTTSLFISKKWPNRKEKEGFTITDFTKQDRSNLLKKFNNSHYQGFFLTGSQ